MALDISYLRRATKELKRLARMEQANDEGIPGATVRRLVEGISPLMVWREHRGLSREALAAASGVTVTLVEMMEGGKDDVPLQKVSTIAWALRIDVEDLVPWTNEAGGDR